jgi:hypothetical protein
MILVAAAAHLSAFASIGMLVLRLGRCFLPEAYNATSMVVAIVIALCMLIALASLPFWPLMQP